MNFVERVQDILFGVSYSGFSDHDKIQALKDLMRDYDHDLDENETHAKRQDILLDWVQKVIEGVRETYPDDTKVQELQLTVYERACRVLEETTELAQSLQVSRESAHKVVDYVYDKPEGSPQQEMGGLMVTSAILAAFMDINQLECLKTEMQRIRFKGVEHFVPRFYERLHKGM